MAIGGFTRGAAGRAGSWAAGEVAGVGDLGGAARRRAKKTPPHRTTATRARTRIPVRLWKNLLRGSARLLGRFIGRPLGQRVGGRDEVGGHGVVHVAFVESFELELRHVHET